MGHVRTDSSEFETFEEFKYGVSIAWIQYDFLCCVTINSNTHLSISQTPVPSII